MLKMDEMKNTNHPDYFRLLQSEVRQVSQPVKVAQLLGSSGKSLAALKNSTVKISQPERITPYLRGTSTQKKKKTCIVNQLHHYEKNIRRNLNFMETSTTARQIKKVIKENSDYNSATIQKNLHLSSRKSLLLPPNTIKNIHIQNSSVKFRQSKSMLHHLNETHTLIPVSGSRYPTISELSENPSMVSTNASVDHSAIQENNKISVIQHTSLETFNMNNQSDVYSSSSACSDLTDINATERKISEHANSYQISDIHVYNSQASSCNIESCKLQSFPTSNTNTRIDMLQHNESFLNPDDKTAYSFIGIENIKDKSYSIKNTEIFSKEKCLSVTTDCEENLRNCLQAVKMINKSNKMHLEHHANKKHEYITLNKQELEILASKLRHLILKQEEDISNLKLMLTSVTNMLSLNVMAEITRDNRLKDKQRTTKHLSTNAEIINRDLKSVACVPTSHYDFKNDNIPKKTCKILDHDLSRFVKTNICDTKKNNLGIQSPQQVNFILESNKENKENPNTSINAKCLEESKSKTKRHSARLIAKTSKNLNDANLGKELNITNVKSNMTIVSNKNCTPIINKTKHKETGRPLREYMALKSRMSCLLTPNIKCNSSKLENNTQLEVDDVKASLSNKLLVELHNLYADSSDTQ